MKRVLFLALAALSLVCCKSNDAVYTPQNGDISFAESGKDFKIKPDSKITVCLNRGVAAKEVTVPVHLIDENKAFTLETPAAIFEANEYQTFIHLSYNIDNLVPGKEYAFTLKVQTDQAGPAGITEFNGKATLALKYLPYCKAHYYYSMIPDFNYDTGYWDYVWSSSKPAIEDLASAEVTLEKAQYTDKYYRLNCFNGLHLDFIYDEGKNEITVNPDNEQFTVSPLMGMPEGALGYAFRTTIGETLYDFTLYSITLALNETAEGPHPAPGDNFCINYWVVKDDEEFLFSGFNISDYLILDKLDE